LQPFWSRTPCPTRRMGHLQGSARARGAGRPQRACRAVGLAAISAIAASCLRSTAFIEWSPKPEAPAPPSATGRRQLAAAAIGGLLGGALQLGPAQANLDRIRIAYPPIDRRDKNRCKWVSSAMGQSNAARDKLLDVRECKMVGSEAADKDVAGALMNGGDFSKTNFENAIMSKVIAENATFDGANFRNAVVDRAIFEKSSFKGAIFKNTVLTGTSFSSSNLENADFTDAYIESFGIKPLCRNPTMKGTNPVTGADTYESAGCENQGLAR